jgi:hypothetical protein
MEMVSTGETGVYTPEGGVLLLISKREEFSSTEEMTDEDRCRVAAGETTDKVGNTDIVG